MQLYALHMLNLSRSRHPRSVLYLLPCVHKVETTPSQPLRAKAVFESLLCSHNKAVCKVFFSCHIRLLLNWFLRPSSCSTIAMKLWKFRVQLMALILLRSLNKITSCTYILFRASRITSTLFLYHSTLPINSFPTVDSVKTQWCLAHWFVQHDWWWYTRLILELYQNDVFQRETLSPMIIWRPSPKKSCPLNTPR